ncbi:hypothetical protein [Vibrio phage 29Fa.3]|nr:hypothetical protein [Vibrio phage 29Fa.3]
MSKRIYAVCVAIPVSLENTSLSTEEEKIAFAYQVGEEAIAALARAPFCFEVSFSNFELGEQQGRGHSLLHVWNADYIRKGLDRVLRIDVAIKGTDYMRKAKQYANVIQPAFETINGAVTEMFAQVDNADKATYSEDFLIEWC